MKQWWRLAGVSALVALCVTVLVINLPPQEPTFRGRRLSDCLVFGSGAPGVAGTHALSPTAIAALDDLGTNAMPTLKEMLRARDSTWKNVVIWFSTRWFRRSLFRPAEEKRLVARFALRYLVDHIEKGEVLAPVVPELLLLLRDTSGFPIGSYDALYLLEIYLTHRTDGIRQTISTDLVDALRNALDDPNPVVRANAASLLAQCAAGARPAVPKLLTLFLHDPNDMVRRSAGYALERIDPDGVIRSH